MAPFIALGFGADDARVIHHGFTRALSALAILSLIRFVPTPEARTPDARKHVIER
jgi:hypothetical protein